MSSVAYDSPRQATRVDDIRGRFDPWLLGVAIALACTGVVMVGSAAVAGAGMDVGPWYFLTRHVMFLAVGLVLAMLIGVNVGPNLTYVGSLATLLWRRVLLADGTPASLGRFTVAGLVTVPAALLAATGALWLVL